MKSRIRPLFLRGRRRLKPADTSTGSNSSAAVSTSYAVGPAFTTGLCIACFGPLVHRNASITHYASVPPVEEDERLRFETTIDELPDPLLIDIFQRLPINSVFRSQCVSKRWLTLISDPIFTQSYISRHQSISRAFALFYISFTPELESPCEIGPFCPPFGPESFSFPIKFFNNELLKKQEAAGSLQLIGCSSDLLLFAEMGQSSRDSYSVCNPLTFQWVNLPKPPRRQARYPVVGFMVEDDGTFWVVQILAPSFHFSRELVFQVFCSGTSKWVLRKADCPHGFGSFCAKTTVVYRGSIMWMVNSGLLVFDPKRESDWFCFLDLPSHGIGRFGVCSGRLYYYEVSGYEYLEGIQNTILRAWMMSDGVEGRRVWVLQHHIGYDHIWSSDESLKQFLSLPNEEKYIQWVSFHPVDSDIVFLKCGDQLVTCKLSSAFLEVLPCDCKQGTFYRLEWDVIPIVFKPWPTDVAITSKAIKASKTTDRASTSYL